MLPENLLIVRHGESIGNLAKRMSERGDESLIKYLHMTHTAHWPLTKKGEQQAKKAGEFLNRFADIENIHFDRAYVSSYARANLTAGLLSLHDVEWSIESRITERNWGKLDRLTGEERREKYAELLKMREIEPFFWQPPDGENFMGLIIRLRDFIHSLSRGSVPARNVIVVCHGEVMKAFRIILTEMTIAEYAEMEFSTDPLQRIHNCQIDHYTGRDPKTHKLSHRLEWLRCYRPAEGEVDLNAEWRHLPHRRFSNSELLSQALKLTKQFKDLNF